MMDAPVPRNPYVDIIIALLLNPSLMIVSLAAEFVICMFYLGAEPNPDRMMWLFNASLRFCVAAVVASLCAFLQYGINRLLVLPHIPAIAPFLKPISFISFTALCGTALYLAVLFFL